MGSPFTYANLNFHNRKVIPAKFGLNLDQYFLREKNVLKEFKGYLN